MGIESQIAIPIDASKKLWRLRRKTAKPSNLILQKTFWLYGITQLAKGVLSITLCLWQAAAPFNFTSKLTGAVHVGRWVWETGSVRTPTNWVTISRGKLINVKGGRGNQERGPNPKNVKIPQAMSESLPMIRKEEWLSYTQTDPYATRRTIYWLAKEI